MPFFGSIKTQQAATRQRPLLRPDSAPRLVSDLASLDDAVAVGMSIKAVGDKNIRTLVAIMEVKLTQGDPHGASYSIDTQFPASIADLKAHGGAQHEGAIDSIIDTHNTKYVKDGAEPAAVREKPVTKTVNTSPPADSMAKARTVDSFWSRMNSNVSV